MKLALCMLAALMLCGTAADVAAQTHPCDVAPSLTATRGVKVGFCGSSVDETGTAVGSFNFRIFVNGQLAITWTNATPTVGSPNSAGLYYFEYPLPSGVPRGTWPVTSQQYVATDESLLSDAALWQVGGKPLKPKMIGVK